MGAPSIRPEPDEDELAAVVAAVEALRSRPAPVAPPRDPSSWRFSGRWWMQPPHLGGWSRRSR